MAHTYYLHPQDPQPKRIDQIVEALRGGAVILYPTDTVYAIGCDLLNKAAIERVHRIKRSANVKPLTFLCASLSDVATYARVSDQSYRLMRHLIPGPFTFLLPATKQLPRLVLDPRRKTTGIRVPDHRICQALLAVLANPLISTSARLVDGSTAEYDYELFDALDQVVDIVVQIESFSADDVPPPGLVSTVIDLTEDEPAIVREGLGVARARAFLPRFDSVS